MYKRVKDTYLGPREHSIPKGAKEDPNCLAKRKRKMNSLKKKPNT